MAKKDKVVRLTSEESCLINIIRTKGHKEVVNALETAQNLLSDVTPNNTVGVLSSLISALRPQESKELNELVELSLLTSENKEKLVDALLTGRNLAILTDSNSVDKGQLLINALINSLVETEFTNFVLDAGRDINYQHITKEGLVNLKLPTLTAGDLLNIMYSDKTGRIIFPTINTNDEVLILFSAVHSKKPVLFHASEIEFSHMMAMQFKESIWYGEEFLEEENFVMVKCYQDNGTTCFEISDKHK